jgi:hypothetical protein
MFACAKRLLQAEAQIGRPRRFEAVLMAVLLEHEKWVKRLQSLLDELESHTPA